jgi:purine-binding chemotaxis protein CheW
MNEQHFTNSELASGELTIDKYLTFALAKECYGINISDVVEIIGIMHITPVPRSPRYCKGVMNLRGKIIPVVDLRLKLNVEAAAYDERTCIIVVNCGVDELKMQVGMIVDSVVEVTDFASNDIQKCPDYGIGMNISHIIGMIKDDHNNVVVLIDIPRILEEEDMAALGIK